MKPILYNATETLFDSYGLGEMSANKATVTRERNGNYTLYIEYPVGGYLTPLFKQDMRIKADAGVRTKNQTFYISRIVKDSSHVIKIYAKHISHLTETMGIVHGTTAVGDANAALARWSESLVGGVEFRTWSDIETEGKASWTVDKFRTAREALGGVEGSILDVWGGEYEFDNTIIRLHKQLGRKTPTVLEYGRNILSAEEDENSESSYTSIYPYASYTPEADEGGRQADPVFVTLPEKIVDSQWVKMYADRRVQVVDFSSKFTEKETPTLDKLRKMAERYVHDNRIGIPKTSIKVEYVDLTKTLDYADMAFMEEVELCDIVPIFYPKIGLTNEDGKVVVVNYDVLNDRNESIEIGTIGQRMKSAMVGSLGERLETLENRQIRLESNIPAYFLDGKGNKVWYQTPDDTREHKVGDTWFEKNGLYDRIYVWNGEMWEKRIDTEDVIVIAKEIDNKFKDFKSSTKLIEQKAEEAFKKAGASEDLAKEAKRIGLDSVAKLEEFKRQATGSQTALSGDLGVLERTVNNEVNQASEHRRTTTEALSRMTGQMDGFATKSEVAQGIDGLTQTFAKMKVGGRNYAEDYDFSRGLWIYSQGDGSPVDWKITNGEYNVKGTTNTWKYMQIYSKEGRRSSRKSSTALLDLEVGETYTLSFQGICYSGSPNVWVSLKANRTAPGSPEIMYGNFNLTSSWQTYQVTIPALTKPDNFDFWRMILGYNEIGHVAFRKVELTRSSTRIDAGPAPEDGKDEILAARTEFQKTAEGLSTKMAAVESYVGQDSQRQETLRRYTREESAKQATAVRELVTRDFVGKSTYQEDVRGLERRFSAISTQTNNDIASKIAQYKQTVDGQFASITSQISGKVNQTDFQHVKETSQLYERILGNTDNGIADNVARMALTSQLFQVEVSKASASGRNLFLNSLFKRDLRDKYSTYKLFDDASQTKGQLAVSIDSDNQFRGVNTLKIVSTFNGKTDNQKITFSLGGNSRTGRVDELKNKSARFSFWAKSTVNNTNFQARAGYRNTIQGVSLTTDWKFYDIELIRKENSNATSELILHIFTAATVWIAFPKIEIGTVATPFSEAPEDTDEAIRSVQSQLAGSWAVQNLTSAGALVSGLNLGANGHNRLDGKLTHITGETLIDKAVIKDGMIASLSASKITAGTIDASKINVINVNASSILAGTLTGMKIRGGQIDSINGNMHINLQTNQFIFNGRAGIEFKSPGNSLEFNSGGRKAFLSPTVSQGTNYAALAFGVNDRGDYDPNRDFVGLKIFNEPDSRQVVIVGDLVLTSYANQGIQTTSLKRLFELINDNFKRLREFRVQNGEGSPGFWDVTL